VSPCVELITLGADRGQQGRTKTQKQEQSAKISRQNMETFHFGMCLNLLENALILTAPLKTVKSFTY